jgi:C4-dicarboxylate-specific signal transduction histidine kinase
VVTERQHTELQLRQQQAKLGRMARLTTAGALGSTIVHEVSQPLAVVSTYAHACRLLLRPIRPGQDALTDTLAKLETALRAGEIVARLRDFLARGETRLVPVDMHEAVGNVVVALGDEARSHGVNVSFDGPPNVWLQGDRLQIEQVLLNLIRNGIEAAAESAARQKLIQIRLHRSEKELQVDVQDNGPGVPPDIAEHLFEPFATRKPKGMGLGLLLSRQIIEFHGGALWHDRSVTMGARFTFRLPIYAPPSDAR